MTKQNIITLVVETAEQMREVSFRDLYRNSAEKQAAFFTELWTKAGHKVTRKQT
jgi:hypothetical protein